MGIIDLFFPKMCVGCRREGEYICDNCQKMLIRPEQICPMCCSPSIDGWTHPRCRTEVGMERLIVGLPYRGVVQQCLKKVKYKSAWEIIKFLYVLGKFSKCGGVVTSVPMWREKEKMRGFNQANVIAQLLAEKNKVPNLVLLERMRETEPMFGLTKKERLANIKGVFRMCDKPEKTYEGLDRVVLVDDVWTTGATMRECAKILKKAGIREVWGVTLAR